MTTPQLNLSFQPFHHRCLQRPCLLKLLEAIGHLPHTMSTEPLLRQEDFTVGWICALPTEMAAACAMLDEEYDLLHTQHPADHNSHQLGGITKLLLPVYRNMGSNSKATVAKDMLHIFDSLKLVCSEGCTTARHLSRQFEDPVILQSRLQQSGSH